MANNRMWIKCNHCGEHVLLAKYYPATGWYTMDGNVNSNLKDNLKRTCPIPEEFKSILESYITDWLGYHNHSDINSIWGVTHFSLEYEAEEDVNVLS